MASTRAIAPADPDWQEELACGSATAAARPLRLRRLEIDAILDYFKSLRRG